jgi:hypothetical protein
LVGLVGLVPSASYPTACLQPPVRVFVCVDCKVGMVSRVSKVSRIGRVSRISRVGRVSRVSRINKVTVSPPGK